MEYGDPKRIAQAKAWQRKLYEAGYVALGWPTEYGGQGADVMHQTIVNEEMVRARAPGLIGMMGIQMVGPTLIAHGTRGAARNATCRRSSPPTRSGARATPSRAPARTSRRSARAPSSTATSSSSTARRSGPRTRSTPTGCSASCAPIPTRRSTRGISYLLIDMKTPGHHRAPARPDDRRRRLQRGLLRGRARAAREPRRRAQQRLAGGERDPRARAQHARRRRRARSRCFHDLLRLAQTQRRNGAPASEDPVVRQRLADLAMRVETMKLEAYRQLTDALRGTSAGHRRVGQQARHHRAEPRPRAHGARGPGLLRPARREGPARRATAASGRVDFMFSLGLIIGGGTSQIQKNIIAERGLGMPKEPRPRRGRP